MSTCVARLLRFRIQAFERTRCSKPAPRISRPAQVAWMRQTVSAELCPGRPRRIFPTVSEKLANCTYDFSRWQSLLYGDTVFR